MRVVTVTQNVRTLSIAFLLLELSGDWQSITWLVINKSKVLSVEEHVKVLREIEKETRRVGNLVS
jgi:hypothetical protein